jgi:fermentation-respiration switch protein FrsA (DUF1100 family)
MRAAMNAFRRGMALLRSALVAYLMVMLFLMIFEESLIFFPAPYPQGDWKPAGLHFEDARFQADDGVRIHGWYLPHERPRATILFCHGNAGNITHRADLLHMLHQRVGASVLIFDYRGYGRSEGKPTEKGILADARAARSWLSLRAGVPEKEIVLMGESLGGGVAVDLAARDGAQALVLQNTFSSLTDVAAVHYGLLPVRLLMHTRLDSAAKIGQYHGPLLQSHGDADTIVPYRLGRKLFQAANQPKQFITYAGADHNDPIAASYFDSLRTFLENLPQKK